MEDKSFIEQLKDIKYFDHYWRISLLIILVVGLIWTSYNIKNFDKDGLKCLQNPFLYGTIGMVDKYTEDGHMSCFCELNDDKGTHKIYSFNNIEENLFKSKLYDFYYNLEGQKLKFNITNISDY